MNRIAPALTLLISFSFALTGEWRTFTSTNYVNGITGNDSVLYLATSGGLQLFHPAETTFGRAFTNTEGLPVNVLRCCLSDRDHNIWLGTDGGGLVVFNPRTESFLVYRKDDLPLRINCLARSGDTILVGTDNGIFVIDTRATPLQPEDDALIQIQTPRLQSNAVVSLGVTAAAYWVGSNQCVDRLVRSLDTVVSYRRPLMPGDSVKATVEKDSEVYCITETGIARYNGAGFDAVASFASGTQSVRAALVHSHQIMIATRNGLWRFDGTNLTLIQGGDLRALFGASDLWLGRGNDVDIGDGLGRWDSGGFTYFLAPTVYSSHIEAVVTDTNGEIYACHFGGPRRISHCRKDGSWEWLTDTLSNAVLAARDRHNRIWFGHFTYAGGVSSYDPATGEWRAYQWGAWELRNVIAGFGIDRFDTKWIFNQAGTIVAIDSTDAQESFVVPGVLPPNGGAYDFAFDSKNRVWFGTMNGVAMLDFRNTLHNQSDDSTAFLTTSTNVQSVAVDHRDRVWIATSQGGGVLQDNGVRMYTTANSGILSNSVHRVRVDARGIIWFLTDRGISLLDPGSGRWSQPDDNRGLIPNLSQRNAFYTWLELDEDRQTVLIGTLAGISRFTFDAIPPGFTGAVRIYPNPFVTGRDRKVVFDSLPAKASLRILTLSGEIVAQSSSTRPASLYLNEALHYAEWDPARVASGIYIVVVSSNDSARARREFYRVTIVR